MKIDIFVQNTGTFVDGIDQDQTAQNMQSDL